jgi:hypothetical protein
MSASAMYATDEYGRPFIIVREQEKKQRISGIEAHKVRFFLLFSCYFVLYFKRFFHVNFLLFSFLFPAISSFILSASFT